MRLRHSSILFLSQILSLASAFGLSTPLNAKSQQLELHVNAKAAILMNADTGAVLYEKNAHDLHYPASITKIVTAAYALEKASDKFDVMISADQDCIGTVKEEVLRRSNYTMPAYLLIPDGSHIGIKRGETLSLKDLMYGMMLASGDDAANVIAKYVGGTIPEFVEEMNEYVKEAGCKDTTFYNPHGLHHPKQKTTAYEMALITRKALKNPGFREIISTVRYTRPKTNKQEPSTLIQTNRLLRPGVYHYPKAFGVKTGYYSLAGSNLVAAAKDGDRTLIAVLLKTDERKDVFLDSKKMFEAAFNQPKVKRTLMRKGPLKFAMELPGALKAIECYMNEDVDVEYYPAEEPSITCMVAWDVDLEPPVLKDQWLGVLTFFREGDVVHKEVPLYAKEDVSNTWGHKLKTILGKSPTDNFLIKISGAIAIGLAIGIVYLQVKRSKL